MEGEGKMKQNIHTIISKSKSELDLKVNEFCNKKFVFAIQTDMLYSERTGLIHKATLFFRVM
jgi:hypothetical protein